MSKNEEILDLTASEAMVMEDAINGMMFATLPIDAEVDTRQYRKFRAKVGSVLRDGGPIPINEDECWIGIHLVNVFRMVGSESAGRNLKIKLYEIASKINA